MSSANLELVRSVYEAWGRGDFSSSDWAHPNVEYVLADGFGGTWVGVPGMRRGFLDWIHVWRDWTVEAEGFTELDDDRILVLYRSTGRMKDSAPEIPRVHSRGASVFYVQDQLVTKIVQYYHRDNAFADLGLSLGGDLC